ACWTARSWASPCLPKRSPIPREYFSICSMGAYMCVATSPSRLSAGSDPRNGLDDGSDDVRRRGGGPPPAGPVGVEELATGLVDPLVHVRAEEVALGLEQVRGQAPVPETVVVGERGG